ncbi:MAG: cytochrome c biogenesis CcdA family protein [Acidimicrobiales bacterium]
MIDTPFALAFGAGMVATVNPCGFAMLPAYLSFFVGREGRAEHDVDPFRQALGRALGVGAVMTLGFVAVFGTVGLVFSHLSSSILEHVPWITIVIGLAVAAMGVALLSGRELRLRLPKLERGGGSRELGSMFLFGVSYAVASLGCTIGPFLSVTTTSFSQQGVVAGVSRFVAYALGMGALIVALTLATALTRSSFLAGLRRLLPYVNRVSGAFMIAAGLYVAYYGWYARRASVEADPIVDRALAVQTAISGWIDRVGVTRLGVFCAVLVLAAAGFALLGRRGRRTSAGPLEG